MAARRADPATELMKERKQFIAPGKCYNSQYQAATALFIPLTITFRSCAVVNGHFDLSLPATFSISVRKGQTQKGMHCLLQTGALPDPAAHSHLVGGPEGTKGSQHHCAQPTTPPKHPASPEQSPAGWCTQVGCRLRPRHPLTRYTEHCSEIPEPSWIQ